MDNLILVSVICLLKGGIYDKAKGGDFQTLSF